MRSSPRMRGTLGVKAHGRGGRGIIPAYAGSTDKYTQSLFSEPDHPRIRGEHPPLLAPVVFHGGSSPRMQGALHRCILTLLVNRIIPAYAGSTLPKTAEIRRFRQQERPKNFDSNTLHLSNNLAGHPNGRAATNQNRTPSHGQHHTCKPS